MAPGKQVFGQTIQKRSNNGGNNYRRQFGGSTYRGGAGSDAATAKTSTATANEKAEYRRMRQAKGEALDVRFGMDRFSLDSHHESPAKSTSAHHKVAHDAKRTRERRGWLFNILTTTVTVSNDASTKASGGPERSGLDLYFCTESGDNFKSTVLYRPYFYVLPDLSKMMQGQQHMLIQQDDDETTNQTIDVVMDQLISHMARMFEGALYHIETVYRLDLDQTNHLSPRNQKGRPMLKLIFDNVSQLMEVRSQVNEIITKNKDRGSYLTLESFASESSTEDLLVKEPLRLLTDIREYDVPYVVRVCTDLDIRAGTWYTVCLDSYENITDIKLGTKDQKDDNGGVRLTEPDRESKAEPVFLAFDIECTKAPLKFPSADVDEIFMISYMVSTPTGGQGYLIVSRSVVSQDVDDFEYTPKPTLPGPFKIFNEDNEKMLLERFFTEFQKHRPQIVVTYNGDFFDWPFVETRAKHYGIDMFDEIGVEQTNEGYRGRCCVHMDAFHWVQRDSYLPQGSQGLKAVTKYKLKYDPVEVDPEDMVKFAQEKPIHMATYSVSDAVATYYLYEKYVHLFIFSLCTIIPMGPEDVLRKGSGTLCESLLMVQACNKLIICPNKHQDPSTQFYNGHLLESETYIGGKVECLETGVYRSDIDYDFDLKPSAFQQLIDNVDRDLTFAIQVEGGKDRKDVVNYDKIRAAIVLQLENLRDRPKRQEKPYVYHLDVGAMYPNIILTNRLQPSSMVSDATCAACDFNQSKNGCKRRMDWVWRGDYNPATYTEYERTKDQLSKETMPEGKSFNHLPEKEQAKHIASRLKTYASKAYRKTKVTEEQTRNDIVCMRENDFYVGTVREFRDRRYEYKKLNKTWNKKLFDARDAATKKQCEDKVLVYDSLQVAHKCILNSFYGYVMRKGARWRSMQMAGIVTKTGSDIITHARILVEQIGRPLELDTDGIWCILPCSFPDVYTFEMSDGSKMKLEYPCVMLNADVHDKFTNHQYQALIDPDRGLYESHSECSIFFEVDGPYRCMVIPASTEEGKLLKKRYAVFNFDGSLAELKGFELKRRGELELIKRFQSQVFERFLDGSSLQECYGSVAEIANHWIDVIDTRGDSLDDDEIVDLISENRNMSRQLEDYGDQKGTSQTTARRLSEFLGAEIIKDKGLNCKFIIAEQPYGAPVTERAIPTAIWKAEPGVMRHYLRKWLKAPGLDGDGFDIRNVLDWDYYLDRLAKTIQKIITIPAALQNVPNPVPRISHPGWLDSKISIVNDRFQQKSITSMFSAKKRITTHDMNPVVRDIEDIGASSAISKRPVVHKKRQLITPTNEPGARAESVNRIELSKDNIQEWLGQRKSSWKHLRRQRRDPTNAGEQSSKETRQKRAKTVEGIARDAAMSLAQKEWHILEVREMSSYDDIQSSVPTGSGEFIVWAMIGSSSLRKIHIIVPRTVYLSTRIEIENTSDEIISFRKVDKHLPHVTSASCVYELTMQEHVYKSKKWIEYLKPVQGAERPDALFERVFESGTPLITRILTEIGCVCKLKPKASQRKNKFYSLSDIARVDRPTSGEYLCAEISYQRLFLYIRIHPKMKTGIVALFTIEVGSGSFNKEQDVDLTRPLNASNKALNVGASCRLWIVKPNSRNGQRAISTKNCETLFSQLLESIHEAGDVDSEYGCVSPESKIKISGLNFVDTEELAYAGANEAISNFSKSSPGSTLILLNSSKPVTGIRRHMSTFSALPVLPIPFPPGPAHNPVVSTLPSLNWEQPAVQLGLEAYLHMFVVSYPKRVSYARYGHVPLGNLGANENTMLFEICLSRLIQKNRAVSWASLTPGRPDLGIAVASSSDTGILPLLRSGSIVCNQDEIWGDDDDLISPVIRKSGCYRSICIDIDVQDLAIAALTSASTTSRANQSDGVTSPNSVTGLGSAFNTTKVTGPLGDDMATCISLPIFRALVSGWLKDALTANSLVADELLHQVYMFLSNPETLFYDPALHRAVHGLMKSAFLRLLTELQRLGCSIIYASFHKVIVATNKLELSDAEEYINFVIDTARRPPSDAFDQGDALSKLSLRPRQYHSNFVFLDEYNYGTLLLERIPLVDIDEGSMELAITDGSNVDCKVVPSCITAWSMMNYLGSEAAQEYFRVIIGKFSKDVFRKQMLQISQQGPMSLSSVRGSDCELLKCKKTMISKHFANYLTRAVGELMVDGSDEDFLPPLLHEDHKNFAPALEFIKNVVKVLELDGEIESEVQVLKRSLFSQVGVAEYADVARWKNPCPTFMLPDVFCSECHESRDLNLCYIPPREAGEEIDKSWTCEDCGAPYDICHIERRLIQLLQRKIVRYQLQDLRCSKTNRVASRALSLLSDCSAGLKLDSSQETAFADLHLLLSIANFHGLEVLKETVESTLFSFST